jgi:hypothetical protein
MSRQTTLQATSYILLPKFSLSFFVIPRPTTTQNDTHNGHLTLFAPRLVSRTEYTIFDHSQLKWPASRNVPCLTAAAKLMGILTLREVFSSYISFMRFSMNALGDHISCLNPRKDGAILPFWPKRLRQARIALT